MNTRVNGLVVSALLSLGLAACGAKEASEMSKIADRMCACQDAPCAEKVFVEAEKISKANEGKEVAAAAADAYNRELDRTQKCYEKLMAAAPAE
jgi:hypothetical protein